MRMERMQKEENGKRVFEWITVYENEEDRMNDFKVSVRACNFAIEAAKRYFAIFKTEEAKKEVQEAIVKRNAYQRVVNDYFIKKIENRVDN